MILFIQGSGGLGREILELAKVVNNKHHKYDEIYFCDDWATENEKNGTKIYKYDEVKNNFDKENIRFIIAVGEPSIRAKEYDLKVNDGYKINTLIHPDTLVPESVKVGEGVIICKNVCISPNVSLGINSLYLAFATIGHDSNIGSHTVINNFVAIAGRCNIGSRTYIGINSPVKQKVSIGDDCIIGMGSNVLSDIPNKSIAYGNPAKVIRENINEKIFE